MLARLHWLFLIAVLPVTYGDDPSWFVVNGRDAPSHAWPHQGAIKRTSGGSHVCGCLYFNSNYAITAAHCIDDNPEPNPDNYYVMFGMNTYDGTEETTEIRNLVSITQYEDWTGDCPADPPYNCFNHDIALLEFESPLEPVEGIIETIPLDTGEDRYDQTCFLTGWGQLFGGGPSPEWLQEAPFNVIERAECNDRLGGSNIYWNETYQVCCYDNTGTNPDGPSGPCYGDSGGPVQCRASPESPWELVGLANWMIGDCQSEYPSAWTRISYYRQWVCDNTGGC